MLYKTTSPSPYMTSVAPCEDVSFSCSCVNTSDVKRVRLKINDVNSNNNVYTTDTNTPTIKDKEISISINTANVNLIPQKNYTWQMRLYETNNTVNIGYGFVNSILNSYKNSNPQEGECTALTSNATHVLKIRPHTDILFDLNNISINSISLNNGTNNAYISKECFNTVFKKNANKDKFTSGGDSNVTYIIRINGKDYPILAYYYGADSDLKDHYTTSTFIEGYPIGQVDSYDNPLFAYVEIESDSNANLEGEYTIYTNYIDSDEFYFSCNSKPTLTLSNNGAVIEDFADTNTPTEANSYILQSSNFSLVGAYNQAENAIIDYYWVKLYQITSNGEILLDYTGNIYSSTFEYYYDCFFSGEEYKLILQTVDTNKTTILKSIIITPKYESTIIPLNIMVEENKKNGSVCIDFSNLISISGEEVITDGHTILTDEDIGVSYCQINEDNTITYSKKDGSDKPLECSSPLLSVICKCNHENPQDILTLNTDDGKRYEVMWTGRVFVVFIYGGNSVFPIDSITYDPFINMGVNTDTIETAISKPATNYAVPYLAYSDITFNNTYYYHTESIFNDFWWHIIFTENSFYIKCLNPTDGYSWTNNITTDETFTET